MEMSDVDIKLLLLFKRMMQERRVSRVAEKMKIEEKKSELQSQR